MAHVASPSLVRQLGSLFECGSAAGLSDRQLLERFNARDDPAAEAAFAAIVARHGPMVLGVCRQLLGDHHHAEDAFQAVFLVLARGARSIRDPDLLGNWLYGVSLRTARKARGRHARRRQNEEAGAVVRPEARPAVQAEQVIAREQAEALHREIDRLPASFRLAVVLCYFEGLSPDEAAERLRWPGGTLRSRLVRARERLRRGLARRGIVPSVTGLAAALVPRSSSASVSSPLCDITTRAAMNFAAGQAVSRSATALAREVLRSMLLHQLRFLAISFLFLGAIATGAGYWNHSLAMKDDPVKTLAVQKPPVVAKPDDANPKPAPGRMFVVGRVLDPQGKPVPNASVMAYARTMVTGTFDPADRLYPREIGRATSDGSGRFRIDAPRTSSSSQGDFGAVALAPGHGTGWVELDPDAERPVAEIALRPEQVIQGRLFDLQGQPARDVKLSVTAIRRVLNEGPNPSGAEFEGPSFWWAHPDDLAGWPGPATTGADGRFTLHGVGSGLRVYLSTRDPRFSNQSIEVDTDAASTAKPLSIALQPARTLTGRVTYADTDKPAHHARVGIGGIARAQAGVGPRPMVTETDAEGRFRSSVGPESSDLVAVAPPEGQPYVTTLNPIDWPKGAVAHAVDLVLPRGTLIRGKVTERGSSRPVAGAVVMYIAQRSANDARPGRGTPTETSADGSFAIGVPARPGHLIVRAPADDYAFQEIGNNLLLDGRPGGRRVYAHAFVARDPKPDGEGPDAQVVLRRGVTLKGRVFGPDGQAVRDAWIFSRINLMRTPALQRSWDGSQHANARDGRFELHGLDPDSEVPVHFLDAQHKLGTTVRFSGKSATVEPITVRLEPCGSATLRLVGPDGKPRGGLSQPRLIWMVVTPGPLMDMQAQNEGTLVADSGTLRDIDPIHYARSPVSDSQGRIVLPVLIPGATYRILDATTLRDPSGPRLRKEFTVKPGETLELGDIEIEKPAT